MKIISNYNTIGTLVLLTILSPINDKIYASEVLGETKSVSIDEGFMIVRLPKAMNRIEYNFRNSSNPVVWTFTKDSSLFSLATAAFGRKLDRFADSELGLAFNNDIERQLNKQPEKEVVEIRAALKKFKTQNDLRQCQFLYDPRRFVNNKSEEWLKLLIYDHAITKPIYGKHEYVETLIPKRKTHAAIKFIWIAYPFKSFGKSMIGMWFFLI